MSNTPEVPKPKQTSSLLTSKATRHALLFIGGVLLLHYGWYRLQFTKTFNPYNENVKILGITFNTKWAEDKKVSDIHYKMRFKTQPFKSKVFQTVYNYGKKYPLFGFTMLTAFVYVASQPLFAEPQALKGEYRAQDREKGNERFRL